MASRRRQLQRLRRNLGARSRYAVGNRVFRGLSGLAALHPRARPEVHGIDVVRDVAYLPTGLESHRLDLYRPVHCAPPWPVVLYVHGGGFRMLSKDTHWVMGLAFARAGYLVANVSYRLAPKDPFPAAIEDVCDSLVWLRDNADALGGDLERLAFAGESAGANLATALTVACCYRRPEAYAERAWATGLVPRVTVPAAGILEVANIERFMQRRRLPWWAAGVLRDVASSYLRAADAADTTLANPLWVFENQVESDRPLPSFFIPVGTKDPLLDDTRRLQRALDDMDVDAEAAYYEGEVHAFHALVWRRAAQRCWRDILRFMDQRLQRGEGETAEREARG